MKLSRFFVWVLVACSHPAPPSPGHPIAPPAAVVAPGEPRPAPAAAARPAARAAVTISILGTNDLHGALERLPVFAGFVANLRAARAADGGGVLLLDGGDMFQGTLESNLAEGADVVRAYNHIGYAAAAVGNHEFDYGPVGPAVTAASAAEDPRGALKARASEARFPFVVSNIVDAATRQRIDWPNMPASTMVEVAGIPVGIIGASTESTPYTTMPANFAGLAVAPPGPALAEQAAALRARGARLIVATMHIGTSCKELDHPEDASSCDRAEELYKLLADLPRGAVDVIVGGHTHAGVAHMIDGVAVIESFSSGRAFGRVDVQIDADGKLAGVHIDRPHRLCAADKDGNAVAVSACEPGDYEGKPVVVDPEVQNIVDAAMARAGERRKEKLGVRLVDTIRKAWAVESPEGNLMSDLMLAARPDAQVSVTNGGGLRADLPAGELTYGQLFEAVPFDNRFALVDLTGRDLRTLVTTNLSRGGGILSWGGLTARARCKAGQLEVQIRVRGKPLDDAARYKLATSDFLASGGDGMIGKLKLPEGAIRITDTLIREALVDVLRRWRSTPRAAIAPDRLYSKAAPRLDYEGQRPIECGTPARPPTSKESGQ
ncbi:MAG TPA: 5'-nucleotidase C-terminal domain-containing protein [Kofleriaceae bacterium]|nr:5'-nucleotidase C-terminal domain-containing protein [Kofleriaceae bacterium]